MVMVMTIRKVKALNSQVNALNRERQLKLGAGARNRYFTSQFKVQVVLADLELPKQT
jgi:hypothetical protein